jgi:aryl-alcohol dehydrogenase-like predicted oxidoreductase
MNKYCHEAGIGLIPWGPLSAGALARPLSAQGSTTRSSGNTKSFVPGETNEINYAADQEIIRRVEQLAEKKGWTMSQVAIAWISTNVSSPIIGFSSAERMKEAIAANGKTLTAEERKFLEEPYLHRPLSAFE